MKSEKKVVILGAAGRDFHNFLTYFKGNENYRILAFTAATQIPDLDDKLFPSSLAGELYEDGIKIYAEDELEGLIKELNIDECILAYSDLSYERVMNLASLINAVGADFKLMGTGTSMIKANKPVISVCATRTGCGKSQTSRKVANILRDMGVKVVVVRHPMPYGDLASMEVQRFESYEDLKKNNCTFEEREEYEPHIDNDTIVYAGVDYKKVLERAEEETDVILWDGGNNDFPFYHSDLFITLVDPHRSGDELSYYPGRICLKLADLVIINKVDTAESAEVKRVRANISRNKPDAEIIEAASPITVLGREKIEDKRVLVVEDGPTVTHGGMSHGAGYIAALQSSVKEVLDPRPYAVGSIRETFEENPHLGNVLPAMGYSKEQRMELEETIAGADADAVVIGTPLDLTRILKIEKDVVRITYELEQVSGPKLEGKLKEFVRKCVYN